jgi:hypothetical protein
VERRGKGVDERLAARVGYGKGTGEGIEPGSVCARVLCSPGMGRFAYQSRLAVAFLRLSPRRGNGIPWSRRAQGNACKTTLSVQISATRTASWANWSRCRSRVSLYSSMERKPLTRRMSEASSVLLGQLDEMDKRLVLSAGSTWGMVMVCESASTRTCNRNRGERKNLTGVPRRTASGRIRLTTRNVVSP